MDKDDTFNALLTKRLSPEALTHLGIGMDYLHNAIQTGLRQEVGWEEELMEHLPRKYAPEYTLEFLEQLKKAWVSLDEQIATGFTKDFSLLCRAEEVLLVAAFRFAVGLCETGPAEVFVIREVRNDIIGDSDVDDWMWNPAADGIDDPEFAPEVDLGSFHPRDWFTPYK